MTQPRHSRDIAFDNGQLSRFADFDPVAEEMAEQEAAEYESYLINLDVEE